MILNLDASILMTNKNRTPPVGNGTSPCRIMCGLKKKKIVFTETVEFFCFVFGFSDLQVESVAAADDLGGFLSLFFF